jgi:hypothetical protein
VAAAKTVETVERINTSGAATRLKPGENEEFTYFFLAHW